MIKVAIATSQFETVSGHAGQSKHWLLYDLTQHQPGQLLPAPSRITLLPEQVMHVFDDQSSHPLDGVNLVVARSAGDGFVRHMKLRGADVLLTGETDPAVAITCILGGQALPDARFDVTTTLCKVRDWFSRY